VRFLGLWGVPLLGVGPAVEALRAAGPAGAVAGYGVVGAFATLVWGQLWRADRRRRRRAQPGGEAAPPSPSSARGAPVRGEPAARSRPQ
jgi:hypothetical protein